MVDREPVIVGAYNTRQARTLPDDNSDSITLKAARGALDDAGLAFDDVDGLNVVPGWDLTHGPLNFGYSVGLSTFWTGGTTVGIAAVMEAAGAIRAGVCDTVLIGSGQAGLFTDHAAVAPWTRPANEFTECWGQMTPAEWAMSAQEYIARFRTPPEQIAYAAAVVRNNGSRNPEAVYFRRGPFTTDDILASRMIASPYRMLECATTSEGGSAVVMTTRERSRDLDCKPVRILGGATERWSAEYTHPPTYERTASQGRRTADIAFRQAGIDRHDVDVFELYDNFSWEILRYFEVLGYCEEGTAGDFIADGAIEPVGKFPICTDGGLMSHSHTGISQLVQRVVQAVRQLRGTSAANQVPDAAVALVAAVGDVLLLGKE